MFYQISTSLYCVTFFRTRGNMLSCYHCQKNMSTVLRDNDDMTTLNSYKNTGIY